MDEHGIDVHFCFKCNAEYLYWKDDGEQASWSLYVTINERMYRWTHSAANTAQLWYIKEPGEPGTRKNNGLEFIYGCGQYSGTQATPIPDINPQNAIDKITLLLVWR